MSMPTTGVHSMWGFSPSMNLLSYDEVTSKETDKPVEIFLLAPGDPRHILQTIANFVRENYEREGALCNRQLHFYVLENEIEVIARHLMLLKICFDDKLPIRQRATLFLEVFGNTLIQERSREFINESALLLNDFICEDSDDKCSAISILDEIMDLSFLKFKEKDTLQSIFKSWVNTETKGDKDTEFDINVLRDYRLRNYYGERYNNRKSLIDWDYHTKIKDVASLIHSKQYRRWRTSGIAYEFGDATYNTSNVTLLSCMRGLLKTGRDKGTQKMIPGYWLDLVVSPFVAWGLKTDLDGYNDPVDIETVQCLFEVHNKGTGAEQQRHHSVEIALYNVMKILWEIQTGKLYKMVRKHDIFSGLGVYQGNSKKNEAEKDQSGWNLLKKVKIIPISSNWKSARVQKQFIDKVDAIFMSQWAYSNTQEGINIISKMLKNKAKVFLETGKYIFPLKIKDKEAIINNWREFGSVLGLKELTSQNESKIDHDLLVFQK